VRLKRRSVAFVPSLLLLGASLYYYLSAVMLPNFALWASNQDIAAPISPPGGGVEMIFQYHGSPVYFPWLTYRACSGTAACT
jgi:hypothetical protein